MAWLLAAGTLALVGFVWFISTRKPYDNELNDPAEDARPRCASCDSTDLEVLGPDVYVCRSCGYEGGQGRARLSALEAQVDWAARPWSERIAAAQEDVAEAMRQLEALEPEVARFPNPLLRDRSDPGEDLGTGDDPARTRLLIQICACLQPLQRAAIKVPGIVLPPDDDPVWRPGEIGTRAVPRRRSRRSMPRSARSSTAPWVGCERSPRRMAAGSNWACPAPAARRPRPAARRRLGRAPIVRHGARRPEGLKASERGGRSFIWVWLRPSISGRSPSRIPRPGFGYPTPIPGVDPECAGSSSAGHWSPSPRQ